MDLDSDEEKGLKDALKTLLGQDRKPQKYPTKPPKYPTQPPKYPTKPPKYPTTPPKYPTTPPKYPTKTTTTASTTSPTAATTTTPPTTTVTTTKLPSTTTVSKKLPSTTIPTTLPINTFLPFLPKPLTTTVDPITALLMHYLEENMSMHPPIDNMQLSQENPVDRPPLTHDDFIDQVRKELLNDSNQPMEETTPHTKYPGLYYPTRAPTRYTTPPSPTTASTATTTLPSPTTVTTMLPPTTDSTTPPLIPVFPFLPVPPSTSVDPITALFMQHLEENMLTNPPIDNMQLSQENPDDGPGITHDDFIDQVRKELLNDISSNQSMEETTPHTEHPGLYYPTRAPIESTTRRAMVRPVKRPGNRPSGYSRRRAVNHLQRSPYRRFNNKQRFYRKMKKHQ